MKLETIKYSGKTISIFGEEVKFDGRFAEVSDELGRRILESGFPNIFAEGEVPATRSAAEIAIEGEMNETVKVAKAEIARLKSVIAGLEQKNSSLQTEVKSWKEIVEKLKAHVDPSALGGIIADTVPGFVKADEEVKEEKKEEDESKVDEDTAIRAKLTEKKKDELITMAKQLGIADDDLMSGGKYKTKDEIIDVLMSIK